MSVCVYTYTYIYVFRNVDGQMPRVVFWRPAQPRAEAAAAADGAAEGPAGHLSEDAGDSACLIT